MGRYRNDRLGDIRIVLVGGALRAELGVMRGSLTPAKTDLFGFAENAHAPPAPFAFERNGRRVAGLTWNDDRFRRVR